MSIQTSATKLQPGSDRSAIKAYLGSGRHGGDRGFGYESGHLDVKWLRNSNKKKQMQSVFFDHLAVTQFLTYRSAQSAAQIAVDESWLQLWNLLPYRIVTNAI